MRSIVRDQCGRELEDLDNRAGERRNDYVDMILDPENNGPGYGIKAQMLRLTLGGNAGVASVHPFRRG